jgi:spermidine synthase
MGATLPVLSKYFVRRESEAAKNVGFLYALNTLGAVAGVLASGFVALQTFGVWQTVVITGALNLAICYLAARIGRGSERRPAEPERGGPPEDLPASAGTAFSPSATRVLLAAFGVSGAVSMMYEISWTRVLAIALGSSVHAFSLMLATFLLGISAGSYLFSRFVRAFPPDLHVFAALQAATAVTALLGIGVFNDMPYYFVWVYRAARGSELALQVGRFLLCSIVMLPPTLAIGAMFSCFIHVLRRSRPLGSEVGEAYFANTIGTIAGSVLTGFCLIPLIGIQNTLEAGALLNAGVGVLAFFLLGARRDWKRWLAFGAAALIVVVSALNVEPWDRGFIASDLAVKPERAGDMKRRELLRSMQERELLFYEEGLNATVTVTRLRDNISLAVNGKTDASSQDTFTQFFLGHLPMALHPDAKRVCVIGLGSGSTATAVASYPVERIDVVELERSVVTAAGYFHDLNRDVLSDPRLRLHVNDGRNFLLLNPDKYDVIVSQPSNPWIAGVANLFSIEYYRTMSRRLNPGGIVCQWFQAYSMSPSDFRMIVRTFSEVFQDATLWTSYYPDVMLIGKNEPLVLDMEPLEKAFSIPAVAADLEPHGIRSAEGLLSSLVLTDAALRQLATGARINSDDHPYLEFSAPRSLYKDTVRENLVMLGRVKRLPDPREIVGLEAPEKHVFFYDALARGYMAKRFHAEAELALEKAGAIDPSSTDTLVLGGILYRQIGDRSRAKELLKRALSVRPQDAEALHHMGLILLDEGAFVPALDALRNAAELDPDNDGVLAAFADALVANDRYLEALTVLDTILARRSEDFDSRFKRTVIVLNHGTPEDKKGALIGLTRAYPRFPQGYGWLGRLHEESGEPEEALAVYGKMVELFPEDPMPLLALARVTGRLGRQGEMGEYLKKATRLDPALAEDPQIRSVLGR